ncbi:FAD-binding oxidoreductase [Saccharomonospora azurea]|uniref:FAD/FMN-dependent dehydrogenase n=1 Tax=Saccharomonospora azurea NA-128 TaxID=882081 RepID=H8GDC1_9PSEU|nr:FAD-binding protein [Saccharomonospora azurea]EHY89885.1 FAD/FMN-dependent dehydrogenase [Saccharomonospora azurea NA-128]
MTPKTSQTSPARPTTPTVLAPTDLREAHEALADTREPVTLRGAGTAADWGDPALPTPAVLDTTRMTGVLAYNPADMTVSVRAGTPLRALAAELGEHGQRVAFDAARVQRGATVGGLVATADSGPLSLTYGSLRDLVIGATVVLADGTVARTGGHVIKNVAGYDLAKLLHGSYGVFGLLAEVVLRLHPLPSASRTVCVEAPLPAAAEHAAAVLSGQSEPVAFEWLDDLLLVRLEGTPEGTDARARRLADDLGGTVLDDDAADAAWARHADLVDAANLRIGVRPSRLPAVLAAIGGDTATATVGLGTGVATLSVPDTDIEAAHDAVTAVNGTSVVRRAVPSGVRPWGQVPSAVRVLRALKNELDPEGRLCPGRLGSWLDGREATP